MPFWDRFKKNENRAEEKESEGGESTTLEQLLGISEMTRDRALQIPAVSAAVDKLALTIARLPIKFYEKIDGKPKEITDDRRTYLLNVDSGDSMDIVSFWRAIIEDYYLGKGGFIYIDKDKGACRSLRYVDCNRVSVVVYTDPIFKDFDILVDGQAYYPFDFIKILRRTKNGAKSKPITSQNSTILSVAYETMIFEKKQVKKGGNKRGFFKSKEKLGTDALKDLKSAISSYYSDGEESEKNMILNQGIEFQETSATSTELQLNENKRTNSDEIFTIFGFPASVIRGGASETDRRLYNDAVVELLTLIEAALDKDLLTEDEKSTKYFAFDTRELTRGNIKERYEAYEIGLKNRFLQADEVRKEEDREPLGFNFVTLGLGDVLLDPKTKEIYVPNTGEKGTLTAKGGETE